MISSPEIVKKIIGDNLTLIRQSLVLTHQELADVSGISKGSIIKLEQGDKGYSIDTLLLYIDKIGFTLPEISSAKTEIPEYNQLKNKIVQYHTKNGSAIPEDLFPSLENKVKNLVLTRLIPSRYLNKSRTLSEILKYFKDELGYTIKSTSLSNTLIRLSNDGVIEIIKNGSNTFKYSVKKAKK